MDRIENGSFFSRRDTLKGRKAQSTSESPFSRLFKTDTDAAAAAVQRNRGPGDREPMSEEELARLFDQVHETGDRLKREFSLDAMQAYREAVQRFLAQVVSQSYGVQSVTSSGNILNRKQYYSVEVIDHKLDQLAADLLREQRKQIDILRRVEEINGILVDLLG